MSARQSLSILPQVDRGDSPQPLKPLQETEEEKNQRRVRSADVQIDPVLLGVGGFRRAMAKRAEEIQTAYPRAGFKPCREALSQRGSPVVFKGEQTGQDRERWTWLERATRVGDRYAGPLQPADRGRFLRGILHMLAGQALLDLEDRIHALRGDEDGAVLLEEKGGVLPVIDHQVDLVALPTFRVDHERLGDAIPVGKIRSEHLAPPLFRRGPFGARVTDDRPVALEAHFELTLEMEKEVAQIYRHDRPPGVRDTLLLRVFIRRAYPSRIDGLYPPGVPLSKSNS